MNDLLDVATIQSGKLELDLQVTDLEELVARNVSLNQLLADRKAIELHTHFGDGLLPVMADSAKIEQVLNNLVSNAVKYSYPQSRVEISLVRDQQGVVLSVRDHGQGIPKEEMGKLFTMFGRTSVRSTGGEQSTGLGLAISKRIVEGHKGQIWVESTVGEGSTFFVRLLAVEREDRILGLNEEPRAEQGPVLDDLRVLLVDDNQINQRVGSRMLQKWGYRVSVAESGEQALEMWQSNPFDLILMDVQMPGMDGIETTAAIRRLEHDQRVPIVALTASVFKSDTEKCIEGGMDAVITKPLKESELLAVLPGLLL